MRTSVVQ